MFVLVQTTKKSTCCQGVSKSDEGYSTTTTQQQQAGVTTNTESQNSSQDLWWCIGWCVAWRIVYLMLTRNKPSGIKAQQLLTRFLCFLRNPSRLTNLPSKLQQRSSLARLVSRLHCAISVGCVCCLCFLPSASPSNSATKQHELK
jgi:hypothetical protein